MNKNRYIVKVGQIYRDWDSRFRHFPPRYKKVIKVTRDYAYCIGFKESGEIISQTRIRKDRFRINSTGYLLIADVGKPFYPNPNLLNNLYMIRKVKRIPYMGG